MDILSLLTGAPIPFEAGRLIIHQPTLAEIGIIGENNFFIGCGFLSFSKSMLGNDAAVLNLVEFSEFKIFMSMWLNGRADVNLKKSIDCANQVLTLLFPDQLIQASEERLSIGEGFIDETNFSQFQDILKQIFKLSFKTDNVQTDFKPANDAAAAIAEKLKKRHSQLASQNGGDKEVQIFSRLMSIISIFTGISYIDLQKYTVFQLYDAHERVQLKSQFDIAISAKMAGASNVQVKEWTEDLYNKK